jgi:predicted transcriptional regulator of viral defense system
MKQLEAFKKLDSSGLISWTTSEAQAILGIRGDHASQVLRRLRLDGMIVKLKTNLWGMQDKIDSFMLPKLLTAPMPSYVSLQSALYLHGMIEQIPEVVYGVTLGRTKQFQGDVGDVSIHHIHIDLFNHYNRTAEGIEIATPEKALFDLAYFSLSKNKHFGYLPELELPASFATEKVKQLVELIPSARHKTFVLKKMARLLE